MNRKVGFNHKIMAERCVKDFSINVASSYRAGVGETSATAADGTHDILQSSCDVQGCRFNCHLTIKVKDGVLKEVDNDSSGKCVEEDGYSGQRWDDF